LGHENVIIVVVEFDENLLFPLLIEANKLLMFDKVEKAFDLHSKMDFEGLFHSTTHTHTHTYMDIVSRELIGFQWFPIDAKSCKCVVSWWWKEEHKFLTIALLLRNILIMKLN
jgi:hypothetical protein